MRPIIIASIFTVMSLISAGLLLNANDDQIEVHSNSSMPFHLVVKDIVVGRIENTKSANYNITTTTLIQEVEKGDRDQKVIYELVFPVNMKINDSQEVRFSGNFDFEGSTDAIHIFLRLSNSTDLVELNYVAGYKEADFTTGKTTVLLRDLQDGTTNQMMGIKDYIESMTGYNIDNWDIESAGVRLISYDPTQTNTKIRLSVDLENTGVFLKDTDSIKTSKITYTNEANLPMLMSSAGIFVGSIIFIILTHRLRGTPTHEV